MIDEMQTVSNVTFGIPSDFPSLVETLLWILLKRDIEIIVLLTSN